MSTRVFLAQAAFVTLGLLAAGCGGSSSSTGVDDGREIQSVSLTLTDAGCDPAAMEVASGPVTFQVENKGASGVTELEVIKGKRILGEVENLADGLSESSRSRCSRARTSSTAPTARRRSAGP